MSWAVASIDNSQTDKKPKHDDTGDKDAQKIERRRREWRIRRSGSRQKGDECACYNDGAGDHRPNPAEFAMPLNATASDQYGLGNSKGHPRSSQSSMDIVDRFR